MTAPPWPPGHAHQRVDLEGLLGAFALTVVGDGTYSGATLPSLTGGALGAPIVAQSVLAAELAIPTHRVRSVHTAFPATGDGSLPVRHELDVLQCGRSFASLSVDARQGGRLLARSTLLMHVPEPGQPVVDPIAAAVPTPGTCAPVSMGLVPGDFRLAADPTPAGLAEVALWYRAPAEIPGAAARAMLAHVIEGLVLPTFLTASGLDDDAPAPAAPKAVLTQNLTIVGDPRIGDWWLLRVAGVTATGGRVQGRFTVSDATGRTVATGAQDGFARVASPLPNSANS